MALMLNLFEAKGCNWGLAKKDNGVFCYAFYLYANNRKAVGNCLNFVLILRYEDVISL